MVLEHLVVVHLIDVVAGQDQDIIRVIFINKIDVLIDGVCSAFVPFRTLRTLVGGQCVDAAAHTVKIPGLAGADIGVERVRFILGEHAYRVNARVDAVREREINDLILAAEGDGGLGDLCGQHVQTAALAAGQKHCNAFFLPIHVELSISSTKSC